MSKSDDDVNININEGGESDENINEYKSYRERIRLQEERARKILKLQEDIGQMTCKERIFFDEMGSTKSFDEFESGILFYGGERQRSYITFNPTTNKYQSFNMEESRFKHAAVTLNDGTVMLIGGLMAEHVERPKAWERYNPSIIKWIPATNEFEILFIDNKGDQLESQFIGYGMAAVLIDNDRVFICGGSHRYQCLRDCYIFNLRDKTLTRVADMIYHRKFHTASLLRDGKVLICGGIGYHKNSNDVLDVVLNSTEIYDPISNTVIEGIPMIKFRYCHTATTLNDGRVFLFGGDTDYNQLVADDDDVPDEYKNVSKTSEFFFNNRFSDGPRTTVGKMRHVAVLLPDNSVFIAGGTDERMRGSTLIFKPNEEIEGERAKERFKDGPYLDFNVANHCIGCHFKKIPLNFIDDKCNNNNNQ